MPEFVYAEPELAEVSGIAAKKIARVRIKELRQGVDWELVKLRVLYCATGAERVMALASGENLGARVLEVLDKKKAAAEGVLGVIVRFYRNPHLVQVRLPDGGLVNLRVRTAVNLKERMEVPVRPGANGTYELTRRLPRFPGRW